MAKGYEKLKLVEALAALNLATDMGVFTVSEKEWVLDAIKHQNLSSEIREMILARKGFSYENGQCLRIISYFEKEDGNYG